MLAACCLLASDPGRPSQANSPCPARHLRCEINLSDCLRFLVFSGPRVLSQHKIKALLRRAHQDAAMLIGVEDPEHLGFASSREQATGVIYRNQIIARGM